MIVYREKGLRFAIVCLDEEPGEEKVDRLLYLYRPTPVADAYCTPFTTLDVDLHKSEEELWAQLDKNTAYEIRRSRDKDKVICQWLDAQNPAAVDAFWNYFLEFSALMGYPTAGPRGRRWLAQLADDRRLHLSAVTSPQGDTLAYHAYCRGEKRVRLYHACSHHKQIDDPAQRALSGRANRGLFWHDMLWFKAQGLEFYDFGGWSSRQDDPQRVRVNRFKEAFGGQVRNVYNCSQGRSLRGRLIVWLHHAFFVRRGRVSKP